MNIQLCHREQKKMSMIRISRNESSNLRCCMKRGKIQKTMVQWESHSKKTSFEKFKSNEMLNDTEKSEILQKTIPLKTRLPMPDPVDLSNRRRNFYECEKLSQHPYVEYEVHDTNQWEGHIGTQYNYRQNHIIIFHHRYIFNADYVSPSGTFSEMISTLNGLNLNISNASCLVMTILWNGCFSLMTLFEINDSNSLKKSLLMIS